MENFSPAPELPVMEGFPSSKLLEHLDAVECSAAQVSVTKFWSAAATACETLNLDLSPLVVVLNAGNGVLGAALAEICDEATTVLIADEKYFTPGKNGVSLSHLESAPDLQHRAAAE